MIMKLGNILFPASKSAIRSKGAMMAGGTGPVRMKKSPNLFQAIFGVFFGILLVIASPMAMWFAQSQHTAKDFQSAQQVEATSASTGYVKFSGAPEFATADGGSACYAQECVYQRESQQELVTKVDLVCGNNVQNTETQRVLRQNGVECDENGDCVPCYDVERDTWEEQNSITSLYDLKVGDYTVAPTQSTIYLDTREQIVETGYSNVGNETRSVYTYFPLPDQILVAGSSNGSTVTAGEKAFVLSQFDDATTLDKLKARDRTNQIILWIVTFFMLFIGISLILGPLAWVGRQARFIPVIGPMLAKGSGSLIALASLLIAIPLWILIFVLVVLIKAWWLAVIVVLLVAGFLIWKAKSGGGKGGQAPAAPQQS